MIQVIIYTVCEEEKAFFVCFISFKLVSGLEFLFFFFLRRQNVERRIDGNFKNVDCLKIARIVKEEARRSPGFVYSVLDKQLKASIREEFLGGEEAERLQADGSGRRR